MLPIRQSIFIYLCLLIIPKSISSANIKKYVCQNGITYHEICAFLNDIKAFLNVERFKGFEEIISTKIDKTKIMNGLTNELINCKGFWSDNTTIGLNIASIVARFYRLDTQQCYSNINYLKQRLLQFLSDAHVTIINNDSPLPQAMEAAFQQSENSLEEQRKDAVIKVRRSLLLTLHKVKTFKEFKKRLIISLFMRVLNLKRMKILLVRKSMKKLWNFQRD
ncbi:hypothetical protein AB3515_06125 [Acinetobacter baumannii]